MLTSSDRSAMGRRFGLVGTRVEHRGWVLAERRSGSPSECSRHKSRGCYGAQMTWTVVVEPRLPSARPPKGWPSQPSAANVAGGTDRNSRHDAAARGAAAADHRGLRAPTTASAASRGRLRVLPCVHCSSSRPRDRSRQSHPERRWCRCRPADPSGSRRSSWRTRSSCCRPRWASVNCPCVRDAREARRLVHAGVDDR